MLFHGVHVCLVRRNVEFFRRRREQYFAVVQNGKTVDFVELLQTVCRDEHCVALFRVLIDYFREPSFRNVVEFVEWFPSLAGMIDHFRAADVGAMCFHPDPNKTDAVHRSNKLFQYMSAGLPVVVSDIGNWGTLVEDEGCGVAVEPGDPDAIADALVALADDPDRRSTLGRNGHRAALERYNWESERAKLLDVYERLAPGAPPTRPGRDPSESRRVEPTD